MDETQQMAQRVAQACQLEPSVAARALAGGDPTVWRLAYAVAHLHETRPAFHARMRQLIARIRA